MQDPILDIFDRTTALYQTIIDKLKQGNDERDIVIAKLREFVNERDKKINYLDLEISYLNEVAAEKEEAEEIPNEPDYTIDAGIGTMGIFVKNMQLLQLIEELDEFIKKHGPQAAINVLAANK